MFDVQIKFNGLWLFYHTFNDTSVVTCEQKLLTLLEHLRATLVLVGFILLDP
jgi:hypothetical protein